jgi:hypothetical protein
MGGLEESFTQQAARITRPIHLNVTRPCGKCVDFFVQEAAPGVFVTTHSPDLLDDPSVPAEWIRIVHRDEAGTHIDVLDPATKSVIRDKLYTPGQLLRQGGLILNS